ncbi:MAG: DUF3501 family protein [Gammaproteobacteria bacterium]|nr:DUF3501 family protein [Gammaproteobacteria bacterium]
MTKLTPEEFYSYEDYSSKRHLFSQVVNEHRVNRHIHLGTCLDLHFEDKLTVKYQLQERLVSEHINIDEQLASELEAYNKLIPDGKNWKVTIRLSLEGETRCQDRLMQLIGIENKLWVQVGHYSKIYSYSDDAVANGEKMKMGIHHVCFELPDDVIMAINSGDVISLGCDHQNYLYKTRLTQAQQLALRKDLEMNYN